MYVFMSLCMYVCMYVCMIYRIYIYDTTWLEGYMYNYGRMACFHLWKKLIVNFFPLPQLGGYSYYYAIFLQGHYERASSTRFPLQQS